MGLSPSSPIFSLALPPFHLQCLERLAQRRLGRDALAAVEIVAVDLEGANVVTALAVNAIAPQPDEVIAKLRHQSLHALRSSASGREPALRAPRALIRQSLCRICSALFGV